MPNQVSPGALELASRLTGAGGIDDRDPAPDAVGRVTLTSPELEIGIEALVMDHGRLVLSGYHATWWADLDDLVP